MQIGLYEWANIMIGIFEAYVIYKFMKVFFDTRKSGKRFEFLTYAIYYVLGTALFIFVDVPIVFMLFNLTAFYALTYNYESSMKNRILSTMFIYLILSVIEIMVSSLTGYLGLSLFAINTYSSIFGLFACRIISFAIVLILANFKNIKRGGTIPNSSWLCIVSIPMASFYIALLLFQAQGLTVGRVFVGMTLLLLVNFGTFYLYDMITAATSKKMQNLPASEQNEQYDRQLEMIKSPLQPMRLMDGAFIYKKGRETHRKPIKEILYFKSNNRAVKMVTNEGEEIFYGKLEDVYRQVEKYHFMYIHKSYVVNYFFVTKFRYDEVTMSNTEVLPISQARRKATREQQIKYEEEGII